MSKINNKIKDLKEVKESDKLSTLFGLFQQCTPLGPLGQGGYGNVFSGHYHKDAVLKVWDLSLQGSKYESPERLQDLIARMNTLYLNPSAHTLNLYHIKQKSDRLYVVMEQCTESLKQFLQTNKTEDTTQLFKIIDQIMRGVMHYHSIGIMVGCIDTKQIFILREGKSKIVKVSLSESSRSQTFKEQYHLIDDVRQVAKIIVQLLWKNQPELDTQRKNFVPQTLTNMQQKDIKNVIRVVNQALKCKPTIEKVHKEFNQLVYKPKMEQMISQMLQQSTAKAVSQNTPVTIRSRLVAKEANNYIFTQNYKKTDNFCQKFQNKKEASQFLNALDDLLEQETPGQ